jgi:hypothetical protein
MGARAHRAQRIQAVQTQLHRLEEWKLADLTQRLSQLQHDQQTLIASLNSDGALRGLFVDAIARRLGRLTQEAGEVSLEMEAQALSVLEQAGRLICSERLAEKRDAEDRSQQERQLLLEAIERYVTRTP